MTLGLENWPTNSVRILAHLGFWGLVSNLGCGHKSSSRLSANGSSEASVSVDFKCPYDGPEDVDGFRDNDSCPDPDNDGDGILDAADGAPLEAEDIDGFEDEDGIPDPSVAGSNANKKSQADSPPAAEKPATKQNKEKKAADSLATKTKLAAASKETVIEESKSTFNIPDLDKDGVPDPFDQCILEAEDLDNFEDDDGCAELDNDSDGIPDVSDACPNDAAPSCGKKTINFSGSIQFEKGSAKILIKKSHLALSEVLSTLNSNPTMGPIEIQGHTDNRGPTQINKKLSERRAASVKRYLVRAGIASELLRTKGFGGSKPIVSNDTKAGRAKNRRVEFHIEGEGNEYAIVFRLCSFFGAISGCAKRRG